MATAKPISAEERVVKTMDELWSAGKKTRDQLLGPNWLTQFQDFFELRDVFGQSFVAGYMPPIKIPKLQMLGLQEATDITDISPRIYIAKSATWSELDKDNEAALAAQWQQSRINRALFHAELSSFFLSCGFIQIGYDRQGRGGLGDLYADWRTPESVVVDPASKDDDNWQWVMLEDWMYRDAIVQDYPDQGPRIPTRSKTADATREQRPDALELPEGPMRLMGGGIFTGTVSPKSDLTRVRTLFIRDYTVMDLPKREAGPDDILAPADYAMMYPRGRMIVEANGKILLDTDNWVPNGRFPIVRISMMPSLLKFWSPPRSRYTRPTQDLAERMLGQTYENMLRVNRYMVFIRKDSGIDLDTFANVPAAAYEYNMTSVPPTQLAPPEFPAHYLTLPGTLMELQADIQGFPPSRTGQAPAGNTSQPLMEASITQSQVLTRMGARLLADSVTKLGELLLYGMMTFFKTERSIPGIVDGEMRPAAWHPVDENETRAIHLDPASVRPMSQTTMRMMVPLLRQMKMVGIKRGLRMLDIPDADEAADELMRELELGAAGKAGRSK